MTGHGKGYRLRGAAVTVCKGFDGAVTVLPGGRELPVRLLGEGEDPSPVADGKSVRSRVNRAKAERRTFGASCDLAGTNRTARPVPTRTAVVDPRRTAHREGRFLNWRKGDISNLL